MNDCANDNSNCHFGWSFHHIADKQMASHSNVFGCGEPHLQHTWYIFRTLRIWRDCRYVDALFARAAIKWKHNYKHNNSKPISISFYIQSNSVCLGKISSKCRKRPFLLFLCLWDLNDKQNHQTQRTMHDVCCAGCWLRLMLAELNADMRDDEWRWRLNWSEVSFGQMSISI